MDSTIQVSVTSGNLDTYQTHAELQRTADGGLPGSNGPAEEEEEEKKKKEEEEKKKKKKKKEEEEEWGRGGEEEFAGCLASKHTY